MASPQDDLWARARGGGGGELVGKQVRILCCQHVEFGGTEPQVEGRTEASSGAKMPLFGSVSFLPHAPPQVVTNTAVPSDYSSIIRVQ